jgi:hypothetical protein
LLWTLLLAGAARLGVDVRLASKVLGAAAALVVIAALVRRRDDRPAFLAGLFLAVYVPFVFYAASGMEAVAFTSLVTLALGRSGRVAADRRAAPRRDAARGRARRGYRRAGARLAARAPAMDRRDGECRCPDACVDRDSPLGDVSRARAQHLLREGRGRRRWTRELGLVYVGSWMLAHAVVVAFLAIGAVAVRRAGDRRGLTCLALFVAYVLYMGIAGGDPPTAFPLWRQFVHVAPAWVLVAMTGLTSVVRHRRWGQVAAAVGLALAANVGILLVQERGGPRPGNADYSAWLASLATPTTTISSSYGGALPFVVDAVHIDALGLNTPYIARHGTFDPDGPRIPRPTCAG